MDDAGYTVPHGNPFITPFNANGEGWDGLLDDLGAAIKDDVNLSYEDLLVLVEDGNLTSSLPEPPENTEVPQEPASVPAGFVGNHVFKYEEINTGSGITDDTLATFEIMSGNKLKLPGGAVLENPVYLNGNTAEIIWFDESNELAYALSNAQTLVINELNISNQLFGQAGYQFYGSYAPFVETDGNVPDALKAMDGVYTTTVYYSKAGNRNNWAVADELMLSINGATGVIDVGGVYSIDPTDPSFSWTDKTSTNPMFNPHYEVLYSGIDKLLIYQRPGEPINGWRLTQEANATDGVNVAADVTPVIETHQAYFETLATQLPATLILVEQDGSNLFKAALCTGYEFSFEANGGTAGKPRLLYNKVDDSWIQSKEYYASSAAYAENSTIKSLYWAGFTLAVDGSLLTLTGIQSGAEIGVVLTNNPAMIAETCPEI